jgi:hypothetical protein
MYDRNKRVYVVDVISHDGHEQASGAYFIRLGLMLEQLDILRLDEVRDMAMNGCTAW